LSKESDNKATQFTYLESKQTNINKAINNPTTSNDYLLHHWQVSLSHIPTGTGTATEVLDFHHKYWEDRGAQTIVRAAYLK